MPAGATAVGSPYEKRGVNKNTPGTADAIPACGTTVNGGDAGSEASAMLSGPTRMTAEPMLVLAKSFDNTAALSTEKGVLVPVLVQWTCRLAGTDASLLIAVASNAGGADPNGATRPSIHSGSPTVVTGTASEPVLTSNAAATGFAAAEVPLPAKLKSLTGQLLIVCRFIDSAPAPDDTSEPQSCVDIKRTEPVLV